MHHEFHLDTKTCKLLIAN